MEYYITANGIDYLMTDHAIRARNDEHYTDEMIIETLEMGDVIRQSINNRDRFQREMWHPMKNRMTIVTVIVNPNNRDVITIYDDIKPKAE